MYWLNALVIALSLMDALSGFPDPFAVATIGGEQTRTTSVIKKTLNPYWNESFDMYGSLHKLVLDGADLEQASK